MSSLLHSLFQGMTFGSAVSMLLDICIVTALFYYVFSLLQGTRAVQLIKGLLILVAAATLSGWLNLDTVG